MHHHSEAFIGLDTSKSRNAVAIAAAGRAGEVRFLGRSRLMVQLRPSWCASSPASTSG